MTLKSTIKDGRGSGNQAGVSNAGELLAKGFGNVQSNFQTLDSTAVGFNFFPPLSGQMFVITTVMFNVGNNASNITVYEATSGTTLTVDKTLLTASLLKNQFSFATFSFGGFIQVAEGEFLNVKGSGQPVDATIMGFYRPV